MNIGERSSKTKEQEAARKRALDSVSTMDSRFEEHQKRGNARMANLSDLSSFSPKNEDESSKKVLNPVIRNPSVEIDDSWDVDAAYRETNALGIPKKMPPSAALKREWPPRDEAAEASSLGASEENQLASASDYSSSDVPTNALGLPVDWAEKRSGIPQDQAETLRFHSRPLSEDVPTNALGIPVDWFERRLAEEEAKKRENEEAPHITQEEIEQIKKNAHDEGYKAGYDEGSQKGYDDGMKTGIAQGQSQGYKEGYADGQEKIEAEMADSVAFFSQSAEKLAKPLDLLDEKIASSLVELSIRLTRQLIPELAKNSTQFVTNAVRQAVEQLPVFSEGVEITLSEHDADIVRKHFSEEFRTEKGWRIVVNKEQSDGDIHVTSRDSTISMTMQGQIDSLIREFIRANFT
jgi:flagellar assembly protein FliH